MTSEIQTINLHDLIKEFIKTSINNNPFIMKKRKNKSAFQQNLKSVTNLFRTNSLEELDSENYYKLLKDNTTGFYIVFDSSTCQLHYSSSYRKSLNFFNRLINSTN